jgi:alkylhydroperoxidase family enzyme
MSRVPYISDQAADLLPATALVRARRGGRLLNLDRVLLHSPALAQAWNAYLGSVRSDLGLPAKLRELAICTVAVLNRADYEFDHHLPEWRHAGGTEAQVRALRSIGDTGEDPLTFDAVETAVLALTIQMTRAVAVDDATFTRVRKGLANDQWVVELVGIIATYNMVSRFLVALAVERE